MIKNGDIQDTNPCLNNIMCGVRKHQRTVITNKHVASVSPFIMQHSSQETNYILMPLALLSHSIFLCSRELCCRQSPFLVSPETCLFCHLSSYLYSILLQHPSAFYLHVPFWGLCGDFLSSKFFSYDIIESCRWV